MKFSHVFITRPRPESEELAALLSPLGLTPIVQPAFNYFPLDVSASQARDFELLEASSASDLLLFTSPRSVAHGLSQLPGGGAIRARVAAIGPATAQALTAAGIRVDITPRSGYTSEALLEILASETAGSATEQKRAFIITAPGGRRKLAEGLEKLGWDTRMLMAYKPEPAKLDKQALSVLKDASAVLCIWTSANSMKALSQRLPPAIWFQLCQGDWLVISERLKRLARAFGPSRVHLASGPGNRAILSAVRSLI